MKMFSPQPYTSGGKANYIYDASNEYNYPLGQ